MKTLMLAVALCCFASAADSDEILALERKALDGLQKGDPDPALAISAPEITYFHVITSKRLDGLPAVKELFNGYRGRPLFDTYEMADSKVQMAGDAAVLTYTLVRHMGGDTTRYYATQVYRKTGEGWRVIHSHWSAAGGQQ
ncbi:MAG TPA: nuclear transport factor 2 family protein [Candidatus Sulfopaludibacter sp.]|jgi:ketosteroid isomerase-like protein|nr:nuclear transport factor 2 family protein [Candidatus Sulfopaludibacter sp.]